MKLLKTCLLLLGVSLATAALPFLLVLYPAYQKHVLLEKKEILWLSMRHMLDQVPGAIVKNRKKIDCFRKNSHDKPILQALEENLNKNKIVVESMRPYQGSQHNEIHLAMAGKYQNLLRFIAILSKSPNSMEIVYLSIEKRKIDVILKNRSGI